MAKPDYDTSLARIAGNICSGLITPESLAGAARAQPYERQAWVRELSRLSVEFAVTIVDILRAKAEAERETPETPA